MSTYKFEPYFTGEPLVKILFSYDTEEKTMTRDVGNSSTTVDIDDVQISSLNQLQINNQIDAAQIFAAANG